MATESVIKTLYAGLIDYVPNNLLVEYQTIFEKRKRYDSKFGLNFFPKFIDFDECCKNPKKPYDILLINYWIIEVPTIGFVHSKLLGDYSRQNNIHIKKWLKEEKKK